MPLPIVNVTGTGKRGVPVTVVTAPARGLSVVQATRSRGLPVTVVSSGGYPVIDATGYLGGLSTAGQLDFSNASNSGLVAAVPL